MALNDSSISKVAQVLDANLKNGEGHLKILLKGEAEPVDIFFCYAFEGDALRIKSAKASKEWLTALADIFLDKHSNIDLSKFGIKEDGLMAKIIKHLL